MKNEEDQISGSVIIHKNIDNIELFDCDNPENFQALIEDTFITNNVKGEIFGK